MIILLILANYSNTFCVKLKKNRNTCLNIQLTGRDSNLKPFKEDSSDINHFIKTVVKRETNEWKGIEVTLKGKILNCAIVFVCINKYEQIFGQ